MKRILDSLAIQGGEMIPQGYGVAWREVDRDLAICYRWPLNILLGGFRRLWFGVRWFRWGLSAYEHGYLHGRQEKRSEDFDRGFRAGEQEAHRAGDARAREIAQGVIADVFARVRELA